MLIYSHFWFWSLTLVTIYNLFIYEKKDKS